jgi:hypothetical protein
VKGATLGFGSLEHMGYAWHDDLIQLVRNVGATWVPTLGNMSADRVLAASEPERLDLPAVAAFGRRGALPLESDDSEHGAMSVLRRFLEGQRESLQGAHEAGVTVLIGTDMMSSAALPGQATHWEMEHLVEAGIPGERRSRQARGPGDPRCGPVDEHSKHHEHLAGGEGRVDHRSRYGSGSDGGAQALRREQLRATPAHRTATGLPHRANAAVGMFGMIRSAFS